MKNLKEPDLILPESESFYEVHIWIKPNNFKIIRDDNYSEQPIVKGMTPMQYIEYVANLTDMEILDQRRSRIAKDFLCNLLIEQALTD